MFVDTYFEWANKAVLVTNHSKRDNLKRWRIVKCALKSSSKFGRLNTLWLVTNGTNRLIMHQVLSAARRIFSTQKSCCLGSCPFHAHSLVYGKVIANGPRKFRNAKRVWDDIEAMMVATMQVVVHFGVDYEEQFPVMVNTGFSQNRPMICTHNLVLDQQEETVRVTTD